MPKAPSKPAADAQQLLPLWTPMVQIPQGDGSVLVRPGRPIERLTVLQFAQAVGFASRTSVYDRLGTDEIPEQYVERVGGRKVLIQAAAVEHFRAYHRVRRDGGLLPARS